MHRGTAWLGSYECGSSALPVNVSDPARPQALPALAENTASTAEDVMAIAASTASFSGDLLAVGLQSCRGSAEHGVEFWDVSDPARPVRLGFFDTGANTHGVHELHLFQRGARVYALLAVPLSEESGHGGDFRIVDATDPRRPVQVGDWGARAAIGAAALARGGAPFVYCHSAWANEEGTIAYLSYWDAGLILLDISDPASPRYLGRTPYGPGDEGNAHSAWPVNGRNLVLLADEDFSPRGAVLDVDGEPVAAIEAQFSAAMCRLGEIRGELAYVGAGCSTPAGDLRGRIALADLGSCAARDQLLRAQAAGARAVLFASVTPGALPSAINGDPSGIVIPAAMISKTDGDLLRTALRAGEVARATMRPDPNGTWGFLRIFDVSDPAAPVQAGSFATENARRCPPPDGGWYTIHNPFVANGVAWLSWYSDGVRAVDISDPAKPVELGAYVPPDREDGLKARIWGVYVEGDLAYLSDIDFGLRIVRWTNGAAAQRGRRNPEIGRPGPGRPGTR